MAGLVHGQVFCTGVSCPVNFRMYLLWISSTTLVILCRLFLVVGSVFVEHAVLMLNLFVRGAGNWLLQNTSVTRKTVWCYHRWDAHSSEPQISLHAVCMSVMSLSVTKYSIWEGSVTLLILSPCKRWTMDGHVPKVPLQFVKFLFVSPVLWVCPE